ncbi:MAG: hypothetical protein WA941_13660 [Nitrososphaeraceae archaeon]
MAAAFEVDTVATLNRVIIAGIVTPPSLSARANLLIERRNFDSYVTFENITRVCYA